MMQTNLFNFYQDESRATKMSYFMVAAVIFALVMPELAIAQGTSDGGVTTTACGFLTNIKSVLNAVSIVVVTIAVIFSGYQIAFAHKRISEVAPVMIGAILIGAASQIAKLFLSDSSSGSNACQTTSIVPHLQHYAAVALQMLHYA